MYKIKNKGFTLIELLVVIAIIGLLASVVIASLNTARGKAADAVIKENLSGIRSQAEIYYDSNSNYGTNGSAITCAVSTTGSITGTGCPGTTIVADNTVANAVKAAVFASGGVGYLNVAANGSAWAAVVPLKTAPSSYQCADSLGNSKVPAASPSTATTVCP